MFALVVALSAFGMSPREAVDAAVARSPALDASDARISEAEARLHEVNGGLLPRLSLRGSMVSRPATPSTFLRTRSARTG